MHIPQADGCEQIMAVYKLGCTGSIRFSFARTKYKARDENDETFQNLASTIESLGLTSLDRVLDVNNDYGPLRFQCQVYRDRNLIWIRLDRADLGFGFRCL